jgi:hypothetical protein
LNVAYAPHPEGPWTVRSLDLPPVIDGRAVADPARCFTDVCGGLYVAAIMAPAPHTGGEWWLYLAAPISKNDEAPLALWTSSHHAGPFVFRAYVLDGGNTGHWDSGRYSESRVMHHDGLFHVFATGSPDGSTFGGNVDKTNEQIGWAISADGLNFTEHPHNPMAGVVRSPQIDEAHSLTTPRTQAMAEGHVWMEDGDPLIYVFHTILAIGD